ncbi:MAG: ATP-dependent DNA helicase RecG [Candidatus Methylopumilus sp.]|nr:ATP-dependent DNA helicase RecG [Candidatus Methylopumilus sp.]
MATAQRPSTKVSVRPKAVATTRQKLERLGLISAHDLILHLPLRYEDETEIMPIATLRPGRSAQIEATVIRSDASYQPRRQLTAVVQDDTGEIGLRWLTFYPNQQQQMQVGRRWRIRGEVRGGMHGYEIIHPKVTVADSVLPAALTPVYPTTEGLSQPSLRKAIGQALEKVELNDTLEPELVQRLGLQSFGEAIRTLHAPTPDIDALALIEHTHPSWLRIKFDELLAQQLSLAAARDARRSLRAKSLRANPKADSLCARLLKSLPFSLTPAQQRVTSEISADLAREFPMYRLLQGDVGSGKTIVAALAALQAIDAGVQVALMAPTEILAEQHFQKLKMWCEPLGIEVCWLTGSITPKARKIANAAISSGQARLVVGTQALIQETVEFFDLGLVIVDEQHRFGVAQRLSLSKKGEELPGDDWIPHQLTMSATPIPRTLAMTFYADLEVSSIDTLPPGRTPVVTKLISNSRRDEVLGHVAQACATGQQVYWVCPLVQESESLDLQTAVDTHLALTEALPDYTVGLVHGQLPTAEKAAVMKAFREAHINVLVSTTVIEVGVDVPNASLMVIEHAERFGLAQLHQLRGRVGRGVAKSVCVLLFQTPLSMLARQRLRAMYETQDGFEIAQRDLDLRGPGELLGSKQSGVTLLRFADLAADGGLVVAARQAAIELRDTAPHIVERHLARWMRGREDFLRS